MLFTAEHEEPRRTLQKFIAAEINPRVDEWEAAGQLPTHELFKKLGDLGFLGLNKPVEFGGLGLDYSYAVMMAEELGAIHSGSVPMAIGVHTDMATPALARFGSDALRREFLAPAISGDVVACVGVSEPGAGSDVAEIRTNARSDGDDYVIDGGKMWITNGAEADWMCLLANTGEGPKHRNKSLICVPMKSKGVTVARKLDKLGMRASDTAQIFFEGVRVPKRNRIGEEGKGFIACMRILDLNRPTVGAAAVGLAQGALDAAVAYAKERTQFGRAISAFQGIQFMLADMAMQVEAARSLVYECARQVDAGDFSRLPMMASMAKCFASDVAMKVTTDAVQIFGGAGYMKDYPVERMMRDAKINQIFEGTNQIQRVVISRHLLQ
jgi:citronellyl-CoA dehydrogenase